MAQSLDLMLQVELGKNQMSNQLLMPHYCFWSPPSGLVFSYDLTYWSVPDTLRELYLNKYGTIRFGKKESCKMVHPNDISKIEKVISYEKYICIDTLAQYLVLNSNELIIRVLPEIFYYDNE